MYMKVRRAKGLPVLETVVSLACVAAVGVLFVNELRQMDEGLLGKDPAAVDYTSKHMGAEVDLVPAARASTQIN